MLPISFLSLLVLSCQTGEYSTSAYQMTSLNQRIGGDKSLAQPGDFMMENAHVRFSIIENELVWGHIYLVEVLSMPIFKGTTLVQSGMVRISCGRYS